MSAGNLRAVWGSRPLLSVGVSVLIQDETRRVLLQRRGDDGLWGTPGGGLDPGEDFLTAARRELREETGLSCPDLTWLGVHDGVVSGPQFWHRYPNGHEVYLVGARMLGHLPASALEDARPDDSGETLELRWFALDHLPALSSNINRANLNVLRERAGLSPLPLLAVSSPEAASTYWTDLRRAAGPRPLFAPGASVVVTDTDGRLLLRQAATGQWALPGGRMEPAESFEACAHRKLLETMGLRAELLEPRALLAGPEFRYEDSSDVWDSISMVFQAVGVTGKVTGAHQVVDARWFSPHELGQLDLLGLQTQQAVEVWLADQPALSRCASTT
ncbi:NUDIX domain-containing protein [Deinococcus deserti]|uniref:Putative NUDIX hydrolase n=1 Tax=Deinococcus deserti (strain DSM 17065 / CIP 109153 / LMG 22923 / VCD115) TaxID=546414 RepID=C1CYS4_DEIDV|nr:NUDIX domain-containing protein [Deinococcus deserti]ACO47104.1 putative NUDIX hydrolase [Deinococcus deserti VCD115]